MTLDDAIKVAVETHAGQLDKAGKPYILHPLRVMMTVESPNLDGARLIAVLHDVIEDSEKWTIEQLDADYDAYIDELAPNPLARAVKIADLRDNLDVTRLEEVGEKAAKRITKYLRSLRKLRRAAGQETCQ